MTKLSRRGFLKLAGVTGAAAVAVPGKAQATSAHEAVGLLIDTTLCRGCRACEAACTEANGHPAPASCGDRAVFDEKRALDVERFTVVNRVENPSDPAAPRYMKSQCMHCVEPACASACLTRALDKTPEGPVVYHPERCMGCRYCMVSCPFEVPRFEYGKAAPYVKKCELCAGRRKEGKLPACAEACPSGALTYGKREELVEVAKTRIYQSPDKYVHHVYGEREVGGTSVLYLSDVPFEKMGLSRSLGDKGYPELTKSALGAVPFIMTLWPPLLMGLYHFSKSREESSADEGSHPGENKHG